VRVETGRPLETGIFTFRAIAGINLDTDNGNLDLIVQDSCVAYPGELARWLDGGWKGAIVTQAIGWFLALIIIGILFSAACCQCHKNFFRGIGAFILLVLCVFNGMIFIAMNSNLCTNNPLLWILPLDYPDAFVGGPGSLTSSCKLGPASTMSIISTVCYFLSGIACCFLGRDDKKAATAVVQADEENPVVAPVDKEEDEPAPVDDEPTDQPAPADDDPPVDEEEVEQDKVDMAA